jgi:energy-coupling factor transporter ATP-binding protein EcfA2
MAGELLFSGQLLAVTADEANPVHVQIKKEAISFLQRLTGPVLVVSVHGARGSGKTSLVRSLLGVEEDEKEEENELGELLFAGA